MTNKTKKWLKRAISSLTLSTLLMSANIAGAAILFQDDSFQDIASEGLLIDDDGAGANNTTIRFGNDSTASENGNIVWDITLNEFQFDHTVDITGDLDVSGNADFTNATEFHMREVADEAAATCTTIDELVLDTTENRIYVCTATGSPGTWVGSDAGTADDFESVYSNDGDNTLTTSSGNFSIAAGTGEFDVTSTGLIDFNSATFTLDTTGALSLDAGAASNFTTSAGAITLDGAGGVNIAGNAGEVDITSAGALVDINSGTFTLDTTSTFSLDGVGASNVTTDTGNLTLATTTSGNVALNSAADVTLTAGDDIIFNDAQLISAINLTDTDTGFAATFANTAIIDVINEFTSTATGEGASNIGIEDAGAYFTGTDVEAALQELGAVSGANAPNNEDLTFYPQYPDTVIFKDGTNNRGRLDSDYDDTNDENYYRWTTRNATTQDIDLRLRFPLPADFTSVNDFTYKYRTGTVTEADNDVEIGVYNATNETAGAPTACGQDTTNGTAAAWATGTITKATLETGCTGATALDAGDIIEVLIKLLDNSGAADYAEIGVLALGYNN